jgi:hypothetical protein
MLVNKARFSVWPPSGQAISGFLGAIPESE